MLYNKPPFLSYIDGEGEVRGSHPSLLPATTHLTDIEGPALQHGVAATNVEHAAAASLNRVASGSPSEVVADCSGSGSSGASGHDPVDMRVSGDGSAAHDIAATSLGLAATTDLQCSLVGYGGLDSDACGHDPRHVRLGSSPSPILAPSPPPSPPPTPPSEGVGDADGEGRAKSVAEEPPPPTDPSMVVTDAAGASTAVLQPPVANPPTIFPARDLEDAFAANAPGVPPCAGRPPSGCHLCVALRQTHMRMRAACQATSAGEHLGWTHMKFGTPPALSQWLTLTPA